MAYVVRAVLMGRGSTLRTELETREGAIRSAKDLRAEGFQVIVIDTNGGVVEDTNVSSFSR
jgi:hypothetical protein